MRLREDDVLPPSWLHMLLVRFATGGNSRLRLAAREFVMWQLRTGRF